MRTASHGRARTNDPPSTQPLLADTRRIAGPGTERVVSPVVPHWATASLLAVPPATWLLTARRRHRTRRRSAGLASPGRCLECGTPAPH